MADQIITEIAIQGQDDVISAFEAIGKAGTDAFGAIENALLDTSEVLTGILAVIGGVGVGLEEWARHSANATVETQNLAKASGLTLEEMSALQGTIEGLGADAGFLSQAFRRTSIIIETTWQEITKSVKDSRNSIINDQLAIQQSAQGVASAQLSLVQARQKLAELNGQATDPEILSLQQKRAAIQAVEQAQLALAQAEQKQREAQQKAIEDQRNSIDAISAAVSAVISGVKDVSKASNDANLDIGNVVKGLVASAGPAAEKVTGDFKDFKGSLEDISAASPEVQAVFFNLADFMKNSGNAALNTALAYRFFGRNVSQDFVAALSQGSAAIKTQMDRLQQLGLVLKDSGPADEFQKAFGSLSFTVRTVLQQIGNLFAPAFTEGFKLLTKTIEDNHSSILAFAKDLAGNISDVIREFFRLISGQDISLKNGDPQWAVTLKSAAITIINFFRTQIIPAIGDFFRLINGEQVKTPWVQSLIDGTTLAIEIIQTFGRIVIGVFDIVSGAFKAFKDAVDVNLSGTDATVAILAGLFVARFNVIAGAITTVIVLFDQLAAKADKSAAAAVSATADTGLAIVKQLQDQGKVSEEEAKKIVNDLNAIRDTAKDFGTGMDTLAFVVTGQEKSLPKLQALIDKYLADLKTKFNVSEQDLANATKKPVDDIKNSTQQAFDGMKSQLDALGNKGAEVGNKLADGIGGGAKKAADDVKQSADQAVAALALIDGKLKSIPKDQNSFGVRTVGSTLPGVRNAPGANLGGEPQDAFGFLPNQEQVKSQLDGVQAESQKVLADVKKQWEANPIDVSKWQKVQLPEGLTSDLEKLNQLYDDLKTKFSVSPINTDKTKEDLQGIKNDGDQTEQQLKEIFSQNPVNTIQWAEESQAGFDQILQKGQSTYQQLVAIFSQPLPTPTTGGTNAAPGFAEGGLFRGAPGLDTNWVKVSDFEYFVNPNATKGWGTNFLDLVNQGNVDGVVSWIDRNIRGFAGGGINAPVNTWNSGVLANIGAVTQATQQETLAGHMEVDLRTDRGTFRVIAPQNTARELHRLSTDQQYTQTGRSPEWKG